jgi:hypothetical protein
MQDSSAGPSRTQRRAALPQQSSRTHTDPHKAAQGRTEHTQSHTLIVLWRSGEIRKERGDGPCETRQPALAGHSVADCAAPTLGPRGGQLAATAPDGADFWDRLFRRRMSVIGCGGASGDPPIHLAPPSQATESRPYYGACRSSVMFMNTTTGRGGRSGYVLAESGCRLRTQRPAALPGDRVTALLQNRTHIARTAEHRAGWGLLRHEPRREERLRARGECLQIKYSVT